MAERRRWKLFTYIIAYCWRYKEAHKAHSTLPTLITVLYWPSQRVEKSSGAACVHLLSGSLLYTPRYGRPHTRLQFQHHRQLSLRLQPQHRRLHPVGLTGVPEPRRAEPDRPHGGGSMPRLHFSGGDPQQLPRPSHLREVSLPLDAH